MAKDNQTLDLQFEEQETGPVTCLGIEFDNDEVRREYFTEILKEKLKNPEFREIEGFPIGTDEAILELSDPPYYTACPNPWVTDFVIQWEAEKPEKPVEHNYHREPFASDVSEGKNDPIYNAHSYHTKVPPKAIMRYILHYTEPGDIIFDGFAGTGMTGIAAQMCGDRDTIVSLGYQVKPDGTILQKKEAEDNKIIWVPFSKIGARQAVLNDLSPAATFIAYNYNTTIDTTMFEKESKRILKEVKDECGWMYETKHTDDSIGQINYTVWTDIFICAECGSELNYWNEAVNKELAEVKDIFPCPHCSVDVVKKGVDKAYETIYDEMTSSTISIVKQKAVFINYSIGTKRFEKRPDIDDLKVLEKIQKSSIPYSFPTTKIWVGEKTKEPLAFGASHSHLFYTKRNLWILSAVLDRIKKVQNKRLQNFLKIWFSSSQTRLHRMNRYAAKHKRHVGPLANTLYISSTPTEISPFYFMGLKIKENTLNISFSKKNIVNCGDAANIKIPKESLDYIFLDPPFGHNIMYSDLNVIWESWISIRTNSKPEAIQNKTQGKGLDDYRYLMEKSFKTAYTALKPGRWMTVEFSNTKASVWNSIQSALTEAGFIVANVAALNKGRGGLHSIIGTTAVKQDLIISAYKPNGGFEERFEKEAQSEDGVWDFVRTHLGYLPTTKGSAGQLDFIPERDPRILFDQVVAYYVRKGFLVPISSQEFQLGLTQRFAERDGMFFLPEQVTEYDKKKMSVKELVQISLFVSDESSAIAWLRQQIKQKPQTFQDLNPQFMQETSGWSKNEKMLELSTLLEENFLMYDGSEKVPEQIHAYLSTNWKDMRNLAKDDPALIEKAKNRWYVPDPNKAGDLEKVREKALLKEFEDYKAEKKKLKIFRMEAVRAGFKKAWQERDYGTIIAIAEKIPNNVLEEDPKLLMWYDQSVTRVGE